MRITTSILPRVLSVADTRSEDPADVAVVIDVLRATSVMTTAAAAGVEQVITCREVADAIEMADQMHPRPLLCGERSCKPIRGFDLGNSPAEYVSDRVRHRTLILTTTNGTQAIEIAAAAKRMVVGSFLNLAAVVDQLCEGELVHLACAGTDGHVTAEDVLLAGAIIDHCQIRFDAVTINDESTLALQLWRSWFPSLTPNDASPSTADLALRLAETQGGRNLVRLGFGADLERCARVSRFDVVLERVSQHPTTFRLLA